MPDPEQASKLSKIQEFFKPINVLADVQLDQRVWFDSVPDAPEHREFVLYLGCNVLRTAHMIPLVIAVLERLGVDFAVVGGPANCCGTIHHHRGAPDAGAAMAAHTTASLNRFKPEQVLMWCPSCTHHFQSVIAPNQPVPFPFAHITEFLADRLQGVELAPQHLTVAVHEHGGLPQQDLDAHNARRLLGLIPGVRLVPSPVYPELGVQCNEFVREHTGREQYDEIVRRYGEAVAASGADTLVTIYHGCHRMFCGLEGVHPFKVENYISILARSLGIEETDDTQDKFKRWRLAANQAGDAEAIYAEMAAPAQRKGLTEARVRETIQRQFFAP